jgi:ADP-ribose pyrophosphatase
MSGFQEYLSFAKLHPDLFVNPPTGGFTIILDEDEIREIEAFMAQKLSMRGLPASLAQVGIVYEDQYGRILRDAVHFPDGSPGTYIRFVSREVGVPGVVILPLYQGNILLLRRFHHATRRWHLEIPAGGGSAQLSGEEAARQLLLRDIEATAGSLVPLGQLDVGPGMAADGAKLFYAQLASYGQGNRREGITEVLCLDLPTFERMIRENEINDGFTIAVYLHAKLQGLFEQAEQ